jgi:hypothetical protein
MSMILSQSIKHVLAWRPTHLLPPANLNQPGPIVCREHLGGLLRFYDREAAWNARIEFSHFLLDRDPLYTSQFRALLSPAGVTPISPAAEQSQPQR